MPLMTQGARALEMVARFGSIRNAAEHMNAAPSAVNRQILNLEAEYGTPLFERLPRGMRLTESGQLLVDLIRRWQLDNQAAGSAVNQLKGRGGGFVKIGVMECLASDFLPRAFGELRKTKADASLRALVGGTTDLTDRLMDGDIDLAVAFNAPRDAGLQIMHDVRLDLGAVMAPDHPLAGEKEIGFRDLLQHSLVLADDTLTVGPIVNAMLARSGQELASMVTTNSITAIKALVMQGAGASLLTPIDVHDEVGRGDLRFVPVTGTRMFMTLSVAARDVNALTPDARSMARIFRSMLDSLTAPEL